MIKNGLSPYHIKGTYKDKICVSEATLRRMIDKNVQEDINLMMNHINSYKRKALFGKSALDLAKAVLPKDFFTLLCIEEIPPEKIILKPSLLDKKKNHLN